MYDKSTGSLWTCLWIREDAKVVMWCKQFWFKIKYSGVRFDFARLAVSDDLRTNPNLLTKGHSHKNEKRKSNEWKWLYWILGVVEKRNWKRFKRKIFTFYRLVYYATLSLKRFNFQIHGKNRFTNHEKGWQVLYQSLRSRADLWFRS